MAELIRALSVDEKSGMVGALYLYWSSIMEKAIAFVGNSLVGFLLFIGCVFAPSMFGWYGVQQISEGEYLMGAFGVGMFAFFAWMIWQMWSERHF